MRLSKNFKGISSIIWIIIVLIALVFGGLISYAWVLSSYYNMPENTTLLVVENVTFPLRNATYFNVTILNPSNSVKDVNITSFFVTDTTNNQVLNASAADPAFPFKMQKGTRQTFKCRENWSIFAGRTVRVEPATPDASTRSATVILPDVKLSVVALFDASKTVQSFNVTVQNLPESIINVTVSDILIFKESVAQNATPSPKNFTLFPGQSQLFRINRNWVVYRGLNVTINVETEEGYGGNYTVTQLKGAILAIHRIQFPNSTTSSFNLTITSTADSTTTAYISAVNVTLHNGTRIPILQALPPLNLGEVSRVGTNSSTTFKCLWNWSSYRNENITINAYAKQGFTIPSNWTITPALEIWDVNPTFDFDDTNHFLVNVTNRPASVQPINVTSVFINGTSATISPPYLVVSPNNSLVVNCAFNWGNYRDKTANLTVITQDSLKSARLAKVPLISLKVVENSTAFGDFRDKFPNITLPLPALYVNVTVRNPLYSLGSVSISRIVFLSGNATFEIDGNATSPGIYPKPYVLSANQSVTIICPWNWMRYMKTTLKVTVYTVEGYIITKTWSTLTK